MMNPKKQKGSYFLLIWLVCLVILSHLHAAYSPKWCLTSA